MQDDEDGYDNDPLRELIYEPIWSTRDVAHYLDVEPATVRQRVKRDHLTPCGRVGPSHIFNSEEVLDPADAIADRRKYTARPTQHVPPTRRPQAPWATTCARRFGACRASTTSTPAAASSQASAAAGCNDSRT